MVESMAHLWEPLGWQPEPRQLAQFAALQEQLLQWNSRLNLTRLVQGDDYWIGQVFDSLWPWVPPPVPTSISARGEERCGPFSRGTQGQRLSNTWPIQ